VNLEESHHRNKHLLWDLYEPPHEPGSSKFDAACTVDRNQPTVEFFGSGVI
jgi:hypothetical protein